MGSIRGSSYSGRGSTEGTPFIQCVYGLEPQIHDFWCLYLERIIRKVHPAACLEVPAGTVGEFVIDFLAENGRRIEIIGKLSVKIASNSWVCSTKPGGLEFRIFETFRLASIPQGGEGATIPIRTGEVASLTLTALRMLPGVLLSTPI